MLLQESQKCLQKLAQRYQIIPSENHSHAVTAGLLTRCLYGPKREKPHLKEQNDEAWRNERNQEGNARSPETQALDFTFTTHCAKQAQSKSKKDPPVQIMTVGRAYLPTKAVVS